jgi:uncharacterized membrane protein YecN with MAPEG domain
MFVSSLYAAILALLIVYLAVVVIQVRRKNKIAFADGDVNELTIARSAHSNATEYIPIALLLMFGLEWNQGHEVLLHVFGVVFVLGRLIHACGILTERFKFRVLGMQLTFVTLIGLSFFNVTYVCMSYLPL